MKRKKPTDIEQAICKFAKYKDDVAKDWRQSK